MNARNFSTKRKLGVHVAGATVALAVLAVSVAHAVVVANNGTDNGTCGLFNTPCRSIRQAIANAVAGGTIVVGPGLYGDLNGNGTLGDSPGEEVPSFGTLMVWVDKTLTIVSRDGAGSTVLDAANTGVAVVGISMNAPGVVFGKRNRGFTLRNGLLGLSDDSDNSKVAGNVAEKNSSHGFFAEALTTGVVFSDNAAISNGGAGFFAAGNGTVVKGNVSRSNSSGMYLSGFGALVINNVVSANLYGPVVYPQPPGTSSPFAIFRYNKIVGNSNAGLYVNMYGNFTTDVSLIFDHNDYFGNGDSLANCGLTIAVADTNATPHTLNVTSISDFWGAPGGPGADPKDDAGTTNLLCSSASSGTITLNVLTPALSELRVTPPAIR